MPTYYDDSISGDGDFDFSGAGSHVIYVAFSITTPPVKLGYPTDGLDDHHLRVGWFSLGDRFDIGGGDANFWRNVEWWNFDDNLWTPIPSTDASGGAISLAATRIRWFLFTGAIGHIHVFGS